MKGGGRDSETFLSGRPWEVEGTQIKTRKRCLLAQKWEGRPTFVEEAQKNISKRCEYNIGKLSHVEQIRL